MELGSDLKRVWWFFFLSPLPGDPSHFITLDKSLDTLLFCPMKYCVYLCLWKGVCFDVPPISGAHDRSPLSKLDWRLCHKLLVRLFRHIKLVCYLSPTQRISLDYLKSLALLHTLSVQEQRAHLAIHIKVRTFSCSTPSLH